MKIYADHAATTKLDNNAFEAMKPFLTNEFGNVSQMYSFTRKSKNALKEAREVIAKCIGAEPEEIFFTSGGTESDNWAIKGSAFSDEKKMPTITSSFEHHAIFQSCHMIEKLGYPVIYLNPDKHGIINPEQLKERIAVNPRLVSIMFANNEIGTIQPIRELAAVAHNNGALFHTDAVQAVGHVPINVKEIDVDMLSASAHKFNGPKGVGFLYIKNNVQLTPFLDGGLQECGMRAGTENVAGIIGMATALKINCVEMSYRMQHIQYLENLLLNSLKQSKLDFRMNGGLAHIPGNLSLSFKNADAEALFHRLDLMGIYVSTGAACNSTSKELSHVLKAIQLPEDYAFGTIRISLGYENTEDEIIIIANAIRKILGCDCGSA